MTVFQSVVLALEIPLFIIAMCVAFLLPAALLIGSDIEVSSSITSNERARLYPLTESWLYRILSTPLVLAFFFGHEIAKFGLGFFIWLAAIAPVFFLLSFLYGLIRSLYLLRKGSNTQLSAIKFVRMKAITSAVGFVILATLIAAAFLHTTGTHGSGS